MGQNHSGEINAPNVEHVQMVYIFAGPKQYSMTASRMALALCQVATIYR